MELYTLTDAEITVITGVNETKRDKMLIVCQHGEHIGVDPSAVLDPDFSDYNLEYDASRVVSFDPEELERARELTAARLEKIEQIDNKTHNLLVSGIEVAEGKTISTSERAHANLQDLMLTVISGVAVFPQRVSTIDNSSYTITDYEDFHRIVGLIQARKLSILNSGIDLKALVNNATTVEEIESIDDNRE